MIFENTRSNKLIYENYTTNFCITSNIEFPLTISEYYMIIGSQFQLESILMSFMFGPDLRK